MLKTLLEPAPRSRSSDNLEKFSPLVGRRSQGDSPLTASPLARRNTADSTQTHERSTAKSEKETYSTAMSDASDDSKRSSTLTNVSGMSPRSLHDIDDNFASTSEKEASAIMSKDQESRKNAVKKSATDADKSSVKLRSASYDLKSPINGNSGGNAVKSISADSAKSPVLKPLTKSGGCSSDNKSNGGPLKNKPTPPATAPKPRPWSMATDRKSGKKIFHLILNTYIYFIGLIFFSKL